MGIVCSVRSTLQHPTQILAVLLLYSSIQLHSLAHSLARWLSLWTPRSQPRRQRTIRSSLNAVGEIIAGTQVGMDEDPPAEMCWRYVNLQYFRPAVTTPKTPGRAQVNTFTLIDSGTFTLPAECKVFTHSTVPCLVRMQYRDTSTLLRMQFAASAAHPDK